MGFKQFISEKQDIKVGTEIAVGKFRNRRAVITGFGEDDTGNPTVKFAMINKDTGKKGKSKEVKLYKFKIVESIDSYLTEYVERPIETERDFTIYFDMDQVLADFAGRFAEHNPDVVDSWALSDEEFWPRVTKIPNFWENLKPIKGGIDLMKYAHAKGYNVQILSAPSSHDSRSMPGKLKWINKHLSKYHLSTNFARANKKRLFANDHSVLIDDLEKNVKQFKKDGGHSIHFRTGKQALRDFQKLESMLL